MDSIYLQTLLEVVERGSITQAAENLCVTRSAVSRRLKYLEDQFGQPLFDRSGPQPLLTSAGRIICDKARRILELEQELNGELTGRDWVKPLRFCCTPAFGMSHLPLIMRRFMQGGRSRNGIEIHFDVPDRILAGMQMHRFDISVLDFSGCSRWDDLTSIPLPGDEILFLSCSCLGLPSPDISLAQLCSHTLITRKEGCCSRRCLDRNLETAGFSEADFRNVVVIDDLHLITQALREGQGITYLPSDLFREQLDAGDFLNHRVQEFDHCRSRVLLVDPNDAENPLVQAFIHSIKDVTLGDEERPSA